MAQLSPRGDTRIPASFPRHLFMGDLLPTNVMFLRHQPLLFSVFHPITGNALMTLNFQMSVINQNWVCGSVCWTKNPTPKKEKASEEESSTTVQIRKILTEISSRNTFTSAFNPETLDPPGFKLYPPVGELDLPMGKYDLLRSCLHMTKERASNDRGWG